MIRSEPSYSHCNELLTLSASMQSAISRSERLSPIPRSSKSRAKIVHLAIQTRCCWHNRTTLTPGLPFSYVDHVSDLFVLDVWYSQLSLSNTWHRPWNIFSLYYTVYSTLHPILTSMPWRKSVKNLFCLPLSFLMQIFPVVTTCYSFILLKTNPKNDDCLILVFVISCLVY